MQTVTGERDYSAPIEVVFDWLANPSNYTSARGVFRGRLAAPGRDGGHGLGAIRKFVGAGSWWTEEVTAFERPNRFGYHVLRIVPPGRHHGATIELRELSGRTHVAWESTYSVPVPLIGAVLEWLFRPVARFYIRSVLDAAARATEGAHA